MSIKVRFDKHGFYHPAYGRLGRGDKHRGQIYQLPDEFAEVIEEQYDVRDPRTKEVIETRTRKRYRHLPMSAEILDEDGIAQAIEEAEDAGEKPPQIVRPKVADDAELRKVTGRGTAPQPQSAQERTTGKTTRRRKAAPAEA